MKKKAFPNQKPHEKIHLFLRRHWISFLPTLLLIFVMLLIPFLGLIGTNTLEINLSRFKDLVILGTSAYLLFVLSFFLASFIDYYLDICIVTDERVVNIEQAGLFHRTISEQNLVRIQDVSAQKRGILQTFFGYGNVFIQTAGEAPNFNFQAKPNPYKVARVILKLHHDALARRRKEEEKKVLPKPEPPKPAKLAPEKELKELPKIR